MDSRPGPDSAAGNDEEPSLRRRRLNQLLLFGSAGWGSAVYGVLQATSFAVIARWGGSGDAGLFLLAQAIATPVGLFVAFRLHDRIPAAGSWPVGQTRLYIAQQLRLSAIIAPVGLMLWIVLSSNATVAVVGSMVLISNLVHAVMRSAQAVLIRDGRFGTSSAVDATFGALSALSMFVGYWMSGLAAATGLLTALWTVAAVVVIWRVTAPAGGGKVTTTLKTDAAMGLSSASAIGQATIVRTGTSAFLGNSALGQFGAASMFVTVLRPIQQAALKLTASGLGSTKTHAERKAREQALLRTSLSVSIIATPIFFGFGFLVGPSLVSLLFGEELAPDRLTVALIWSSPPVHFLSMLIGQFLAARKLARNAIESSVAGLIAAGFGLLTIGLLLGLPGIAMTLYFSYLARAATAFRRLRAAWSRG